MKKLLSILAVALVATVLASCTKEVEESGTVPSISKSDVSAVVPQPVRVGNPASKGVSYEDGDLKFGWIKDIDAISVNAGKNGESLIYTVKAVDEDPARCTFKVENFRLDGMMEYYALYPKVRSTNTTVPFDMTGQCQKTFEDYSHLCEYSYMTAGPSKTNRFGGLEFLFRYRVAWVVFNISSPKDFTAREAVLSSTTDCFIADGTIATADGAKITAANCTNEMKLLLGEDGLEVKAGEDYHAVIVVMGSGIAPDGIRVEIKGDAEGEPYSLINEDEEFDEPFEEGSYFDIDVKTPLIIDVESVSLDATELELVIGNTETLTATVLPESATDKSVSWSSDDETVVTVVDGVVTAVGEGVATVTVTTTDGAKTATCTVTVTIDIESVSLDVDDMELVIGESKTLTATVLPEDAINKSVTWTSDDETVATVKDGVVTAIGEGTATITVTTVIGSFTATCTVTVTDGSGIPAGAGKGIFTVDAKGTEIRFAKSNLYYNGTKWGFEKYAYDYRSYAGAYSCINGTPAQYGTPEGNWGLFGWVADASTKFTDAPEKYGVTTSTATDSDPDIYYGHSAEDKLKADWGTLIDSKGTWRTLTADQWNYLLHERAASSIYDDGIKDNVENARWARGTIIWDESTKVPGLILFPNEYTHPEDLSEFKFKEINDENGATGVYNLCTVDVWKKFENAGCVFLPAPGCRIDGTSFKEHSQNIEGWYWSSTALEDGRACVMYFNSLNVKVDRSTKEVDHTNPRSNDRNHGCAVRLVTVVPDEPEVK